MREAWQAASCHTIMPQRRLCPFDRCKAHEQIIVAIVVDICHHKTRTLVNRRRERLATRGLRPCEVTRPCDRARKVFEVECRRLIVDRLVQEERGRGCCPPQGANT